MWKCKHCAERIEENFEGCWKCGYARDGTAPAEGFTPDASLLDDEAASRRDAIRSRKAKAKDRKQSSGFAPLFVIGAAFLGFFLFFHVVTDPLRIFPKQYPSFANTFVDLDEYVRHYSDGNFVDQVAMRQTYLFQQLKEKGLIVKKDHDGK